MYLPLLFSTGLKKKIRCGTGMSFLKFLKAKLKYGVYLNILKIGMSESFQLFESFVGRNILRYVHCQAKDFALGKLFKDLCYQHE